MQISHRQSIWSVISAEELNWMIMRQPNRLSINSWLANFKRHLFISITFLLYVDITISGFRSSCSWLAVSFLRGNYFKTLNAWSWDFSCRGLQKKIVYDHLHILSARITSNHYVFLAGVLHHGGFVMIFVDLLNGCQILCRQLFRRSTKCRKPLNVCVEID